MKRISIILTRYNEPNYLVIPCLESLSKQKNINSIIYFLDQRNDKKIREFCRKLTNKRNKIIYKKIQAKSLSYARNFGIKLSKTNLVLFTDCDAILEENWAFELSKTFDINKKIVIVGGKSQPLWLEKTKWYHKSNIIRDIYSLFDIGDEIKQTDRIVGVNFAIRKDLLGGEAYFNKDLGRRPGSLLGGEESDLCKRTIKKNLLIYYTPNAIIKHQIQKDRMSLKWIIRRFYYGGYSKALTGGSPKTYSDKRNIYDILLLVIIIIPYLFGYLVGKLK